MLFASRKGHWRRLLIGAVVVGGAFLRAPVGAAQRPPTPATAAPIERLSDDRVRVGTVLVDMASKEVSVEGTVNDVNVLEFIAVPKNGFKAYESALELETNSINFNLALILIGLDSSRAVHPQRHLDPTPPQGDPVDVWVEWGDGPQRRRIRIEEMVYNDITMRTLAEGPWVYTGSVFSETTGAYLADVEGSLIGFVHSPAPLIDNPRPLSPGVYGNSRINPALGLKPGTKVRLIVRALPRDR